MGFRISVVLIAALLPFPAAGQLEDIPISGVTVPSMAGFDHMMIRLMKKWRIPGGAVAVGKDGRLVLARGYGYADKREKSRVLPDSLFRIASVSKPITAVAILKLVEEGKLSLDDHAFAIVIDGNVAIDGGGDPRLADITIGHLLGHTGGWDRRRSGDPMRQKVSASSSNCEAVIWSMLRRSLDFSPGRRYAYSNFGYCVLGRVIERITGRKYEDYVRSEILQPMGITRMRIGKSVKAGRAKGEVTYYSRGSRSPYGGFSLEALDSHGGWIGSAIDLVRFAAAVDGDPEPPDLLAPTTVENMVSRPEKHLWVAPGYYYSKGWFVRPRGPSQAWWHPGELAGTLSILVRTYDGLIWAALFNARPRGSQSFTRELESELWKAARSVVWWPLHDLFEHY